MQEAHEAEIYALAMLAVLMERLKIDWVELTADELCARPRTLVLIAKDGGTTIRFERTEPSDEEKAEMARLAAEPDSDRVGAFKD